ncbi:acyl-CoA dehydrogenase family protein [Marinigracilibium pacificum]|uniref:Acyl-CoA dehydrogenase n=1 Tax=Marinigracilibium pacificum TaxID=2729599 RepID=A0A848J6D3_9BACT|nr:acyl-CoA dehydrogenase family protein [Marinigracilibium pacificum]NMM49939.1 acyl-CoA dehydrogenase [Marinigracilibium pacificum]
MVDIFATDRLKRIYPKVKAFVEEELIPLEAEFLSKPFFEVEAVLNEKRALAKKLGIWTPYLPEDEGGAGLNLVEFAQVSELLARTVHGHYCLNCQAPDIGNIELMSKYATNQLKEKYLEPLIHGNIRSCFSMTEPEFAGSNPVNMGTIAKKEGNEYVINGNKWFTTAADGSAFAIVMAVTNPEESPYKRASMIIVPTDNPGFNLLRNIPIMGEAGEGHSSHAEIRYENCRVPVENLIGEEGAGFMLAQQRLGPGRIHHCMRWIGIAERSLDLMCKRAVSRSLGGDTCLAHKQTIQNWIAESRASINAARYSVLHAAYKIDQEGSKSARHEISAIKFFVANIMLEVLDKALQTHGALGMTDDSIISHWYRHERAARIYDGPDEVHKASLARSILKDYGFNSKKI